MKFLKTACLLFASTLVVSSLSAQEEKEEKYSPVNMSLQVKNSHIWRGLEVSDNALIDGDLRLVDKSNTFGVGIWGATTFDTDFKEFDYYVSFKKAGFSLEVWDIFNYSKKNTKDANNLDGYNTDDAFDYSAHTTGRFIDVRLGYQLPVEKFPLNISWNTVVFGRDRSVVKKDNTGYEKTGNNYSTYVELGYPILRNQVVDLDVAVGGAFAFRPGYNKSGKKRKNFYGETAGIVNVSLEASRTVKLGSYELPISLTGIWNPQHQKTYMQIALDVLQF